jgi:ubiquitin-protein ligase
MNPRIRRLQSDYERVLAALAQHPHIRLLGAEGNPPEKYKIEFSLPGLVPQGNDGCAPGSTHQAEIFLPLDYPRRPPFCRMITPVFHPNIDPQKICIGDHWSAGQTLSQMIVHIAEMICYQSYNVKSPLNAHAAAWAEQHAAELPLHKSDLSTGL